MDINIQTDGTEMVVSLGGKLDTAAAPALERELGVQLEWVDSLILDFAKLRSISSAGLRILLLAYKKMAAKDGKMLLRHVNAMIMEIFEVAGFLEILEIENE